MPSEAPRPVAAAAPAAPEAPVAPAAPEAPAAPAAPAAPTPPADSAAKSFEKLAQRSAEIRAREDRLKPLEALATRLDAKKLEALAEAAKGSDPVAALAALGFSHDDYVKRAAAPVPAAPAAIDPTIAQLQEQVAALRAQSVESAAAQGRAKVSAQMANMAKAGKFQYLGDVEGATDRAMAVLEDYVTKNGPPSADEVDVLMEMSLKYVDEQLAAEAARWDRVLTARKKAGTVPEVAPPAQAPSAPSSLRTLSNQLSSPAPAQAGTQPKTAQDYRLAALEALKSAVKR